MIVTIKIKASANVLAWSNREDLIGTEVFANFERYGDSDSDERMIYMVRMQDNPQLFWGNICSGWIEVEDADIV